MSTSKVEAPAEWTIDGLAHDAGLVVSTIRLYQQRGLLPPPVRRGRVGYYDRAHLLRLQLIVQLQQRGFSLAGIKALLDGMERGQSLQAVLGVSADHPTWTEEQPETMPLAQLAGRLPGVELDGELVRRATELGLLDLSGEGGRVILRSPTFLRVGSRLAALGVPSDAILDEYERLRADAASIAERFTQVFRSHLWEPFVERGMPAAEVSRLIGALEELGEIAEAVVATSLRQALQQVAERFVESEAVRLGLDIPRPGHIGDADGIGH